LFQQYPYKIILKNSYSPSVAATTIIGKVRLHEPTTIEWNGMEWNGMEWNGIE